MRRANFPPRLQKQRSTGIVRVRIFTPHGAQWVSTGQTNHIRAKEVCTKAMIEQLQMAACANALTADVISRLTTGRRFTCADILDAWKQEALIDLAPDTFNAYYVTLKQWMEETDCARLPLSSVKRTDLSRWVNAPELSAGSRKGRLSSVRSYYKFASAAGYCVGNLAERVQVKVRDLLFSGLEPKRTVPITPEEFEQLLASEKLTGFWRWATILGYWAGYRIRDIATFEWASIKPESLVIYVDKTGRRLELPIDDPLFGGGVLRQVFTEIVQQSDSGSPFCFPRECAVALDPKRRARLSYTYTRILNRHGIEGKRFHSLRHAMALRLKRAGQTLEMIAERMGHRSTEVTKIYTEHD